MRKGRTGSNGWAAKVVAGLFVFHALLLGFSLGAKAEPVRLDQFGNVLCVTGEFGPRDAGDDGAGHRSGKLDCCQPGCGMSGGSVAPPPTDASVAAERPLVRMLPVVFYEDRGSSVPKTPRRTRGPPPST